MTCRCIEKDKDSDMELANLVRRMNCVLHLDWDIDYESSLRFRASNTRVLNDRSLEADIKNYFAWKDRFQMEVES